MTDQALAPVVHTKADPKTDLLLQIRAIVSREEELKELFTRFRSDSMSVEWLRDHLATRIAPVISLDCEFQDVVEACLYLADEYNQLGEGYFIVSTDTGKVTAVLTEDDLYNPGKMARHSGEEVQGLQHIKPGKATMLTTYHHQKAKEEELLAKLAAKHSTTALLREDGDKRLRIATRGGRKDIVQELAGDDPRELLRRSSGTTGMFLRHFPLVDEPPKGDFEVIEGGAAFRSTLKVQDPLSMNISHNRLGTLRGAAPQGWVRDICRQLSERTFRSRRGFPLDAEDLSFGDLDGVDLWIADPNAYKLMLQIHPTVKAVPVEGVSPISLNGECGYLVVPSEFTVESSERFQRWEVVANLSFKLYVNKDAISVLNLIDVPQDAVKV